jgi:hypothetical protein
MGIPKEKDKVCISTLLLGTHLCFRFKIEEELGMGMRERLRAIHKY